MMMTIDLAPSLQRLIDARLDTIERTLMSNGAPRSDRKQIVAAIEDQLLEMLSRIEGGEPTREDVLKVLAALDPPEAFLEDGVPPLMDAIPQRRSLPLRRVPKYNVLAVVGFVATCINLFFGLSWWIMGMFGLMLVCVVSIAATACGIIALCQLQQKPERGLWMGIIACLSMVFSIVLVSMTYLLLSLE